ncbi:hypothetical protein FQA39_LY07562 [Lamprigera yunnana]|nr:hypothetical protein FQA39_LY07562 [Lamprigera yunnana]
MGNQCCSKRQEVEPRSIYTGLKTPGNDVDTKRGVDAELEIGRRSDGELDATDGELNPEVLLEGLVQEETAWSKFIVESSSNNFKNLA